MGGGDGVVSGEVAEDGWQANQIKRVCYQIEKERSRFPAIP